MAATKVLVVGSTSGCGLEVTKLLSASDEFEVHALVRDQDRARKALGSAGEKVKLIIGDVTKKETLVPACQGMDAVVCTIGARAGWTPAKDTPKYVDYLGVKDLSEASATAKVPRFLLVSSMCITRPFNPVVMLLNTVKGRVFAWKLKVSNLYFHVFEKRGGRFGQGEQAVKEAYSKDTDLGYYIIRPGGLNNNEGGKHKIIAEQGDKGLGTISRKDVALVIQACIQGACPHKNVTFEIMNDKSAPSVDLHDVLSKLTPD